MADKTLNNAVNDWDNASHFNPPGVPVPGVDTFILAAGQELIMPGRLVEVCDYTHAGDVDGEGDPIYSKITLQDGCVFKLTAAPTITDWTVYEFQGNATIDTNGYNFTPTIADASGVRFKIYATGTALGGAKARVKSTAAKANFLSTGNPLSCFVEFDNIEIDNVHWRGGGSFYAGNHYRIRNIVAKNYGAFSMYGEQNDGSDVILENAEFRNCDAPQEVNLGTAIADLSFMPTGPQDGSGITGVRSFKNVVFDASDTPGVGIIVKIFRLNGFVPENIVFIACQAYTWQSYTYWDGIFAAIRNENNAFFGVLNANHLVVVSDGDNPKHFEGRGTWNEPAIECKWLSGTSLDAGDLYVIGNSEPLVLIRPLLVDEFGSGLVNALGAERGANVTVDGGTYVVDVRHPQNGFFRNEGGGQYTGTVTVHNCLNYIRTNVNSAATIYGFNFGENTADDQLTSHGHNCWVNYPDNSNAAIYHEVNSATKVLGQAGWGDNDITDNPVFVDHNRGIMAWGAARGADTYAEAVQELARGVNGYDKASGTIDGGDVVVDAVKVYYAYFRGGYAPTSTVYKLNDTTGLRSRGAVDWVPAGGGGGSVTNLQNYTLANYGLRNQSL